jgi:hypothetical protein
MRVALRSQAVLEQLSLELSDLPLASMLCKTFFNCGLGSEEEAVMTIGESDILSDMVRMLLDQCAEPEFAREVAADGGDSGVETLRVCMAVARALFDQLQAKAGLTGSLRPSSDNSDDLVPLPMPNSEDCESLSTARQETAASASAAARASRLHVLRS